jgi:hypothetical protein
MTERVVQLELAMNGIATWPCSTIDELDQYSRETNCRPYLVPDMNLSLLDSAEERRRNET